MIEDIFSVQEEINSIQEYKQLSIIRLFHNISNFHLFKLNFLVSHAFGFQTTNIFNLTSYKMTNNSLKQCLSNIAFNSISMGIFLRFRHRIFLKNSFQNSFSPLCLTLLSYQHKNKILSSRFYLINLSKYILTQSCLIYLIEKYRQNLTFSYKDYNIESINIISPILFFIFFKLPLIIGLLTGIVSNHIIANQLNKIKKMLN